jgi:hypothetical protein
LFGRHFCRAAGGNPDDRIQAEVLASGRNVQYDQDRDDYQEHTQRDNQPSSSKPRSRPSWRWLIGGT